MSNDFENVLATTGWGVYQYFIIALCCVCTLAEAGASTIVLIVAPLLACDLKLNRSQASALNAACSFGTCEKQDKTKYPFGMPTSINPPLRIVCGKSLYWQTGMAVGAFLFGAISDANGRKGSIPITIVIVFCGSIALSFAQINFLINLAIFVIGVGLAGNNVALRVYLIECIPERRRGCSLAFLDLLWVLGYLLTLGISWSLISLTPSIIRIQEKKFRMNSWRVLAGLGGGPCLAIACILSLLPPSPRYLLYRGHHEEALNILQQMYAINNSKHVDTYPSIDLHDCIQEDEDDDEDSSNVFRMIYGFTIKTCKRIGELFEGPFKCTTILSILLWLFHFPGLLWFALWGTEILEGLGKEKRVNQMELNSTCILDAEDLVPKFLRDCEEVNFERFQALSLVSLSYVLGEALLAAGVDLLKKNTFLISSRIAGAAAAASLIFTIRHELRVLLVMLILAAFTISWTVTTTQILENYPTRLRGTAVGLTRTLPYLIASFAKLLLKMQCLHSAMAVSAMFAGAAIIGLPLRDLTRQPIQE